MKEREPNRALIYTTIAAGIIGLLSLAAFSPASRRKIGERDNWTCQVTGKRFQDGWVVHMAHKNHDKSRADYDDPDNGITLAVEAHLAQHIAAKGQADTIGLCEAANDFAIAALLRTERRTRRWLEAHSKKKSEQVIYKSEPVE
jgi:hypothetical protein